MLHVGLIGASGFGQHHLQGLQNSPYVEAISLAGRNREKLEALSQRFRKVRHCATNYEELLCDSSIDLIDVALPHDLHLPVALSAFGHGKHVLMEKPPARTLAELTAMTDAAANAQRRLFIVINLLYTPIHHVARRIIDSGLIGQPFLSFEINVASASRVYHDPNNWRADRERCGGGLLIDGGFHAIYRQLFFLERLGTPLWLTADCAQIGVSLSLKGEDFAALTLAYASGARIHLMNQWTARAGFGPFQSGILGTEATLAFTGHSQNPLVIRKPNGDEEAVPIPQGPQGFPASVTACVEHYLEALVTDQPPYSDLDLAMLTLEAITSAYDAAQQGMRLPLQTKFRTHFPPDYFRESS